MSSDTTAAFTPPRPLAADDDTAAFDCGRDALNRWFRRHAWRNQELGVSRTSVICDAQAGSIVGYVSLSTAQVERAWLPKAQQRNRPDPMPAILLGQLAVDLRWQGQGIAQSLMFYALNTAVRLSDQVGCFCVLTHPLDDEVRALHAAFGFEDLPFDPARSMAVRIVDLVRSTSGPLTELIDRLIGLKVPGGQRPDGSQKPGFFEYDRGRITAVYDPEKATYVPLDPEGWTGAADRELGDLPQPYRPWKVLLQAPDRDATLGSHFKALAAMSTLGADIARRYHRRSREIGEGLVAKGVAARPDDVNGVLTSGFFHLYGPINDYLK